MSMAYNLSDLNASELAKTVELVTANASAMKKIEDSLSS